MRCYVTLLLVVLFCLLLFALTQGLDPLLAQWIATHLPNEFIAPLNALTLCLDATFVFCLLLLVLLVCLSSLYFTTQLQPRQYLNSVINFILEAFAVLLVAACIMPFFKLAFGRLRPHFYLQTGEYLFRPFCNFGGANSFPSGHSQVAGSLSALAYYTLSKHSKFIVVMVGIALASTRLWLNQHFLSDVLAGFAIGWLLVLGLQWCLHRLGDRCLSKWLLSVLEATCLPKVKANTHAHPTPLA